MGNPVRPPVGVVVVVTTYRGLAFAAVVNDGRELRSRWVTRGYAVTST
jgi:hypothetical protein